MGGSTWSTPLWQVIRRVPKTLRQIMRAAVEFGVKYLTMYAFSTENWRRPQDEVKGLMLIIEDVIERELAELHKEGVQLRHIGRLEGLTPQLITKVKDAIQLTKNNDRLVLCIAFNYGGRDEIVYAIRRMLSDRLILIQFPKIWSATIYLLPVFPIPI